VIPLALQSISEAEQPFVTRLRVATGTADAADSILVAEDIDGATFAGRNGLVSISGSPAAALDGDVVLVSSGV